MKLWEDYLAEKKHKRESRLVTAVLGGFMVVGFGVMTLIWWVCR